MKKSLLALIIVLSGCASIGVSEFIQSQVNSGQEKLSSAESSLSTLGKVSSISPMTKSLDESLNRSASSKLEAGSKEIETFTFIAHLLRIAGIILLIVGGVIFFKQVKKK